MPPAQIFPVADVLTGISAALDVFVVPGTGVIIPTPAYPPFFEVVELGGRQVVSAPMIHEAGRDTLDLGAIDAARWRGLRVFEVPRPTPLGIAATTAGM